MPSENYLFLLILFIWFVFPLKNGKNKQEQYNTGLWSRKDQLGRQEQTPIVLLQVCLNVLYCLLFVISRGSYSPPCRHVGDLSPHKTARSRETLVSPQQAVG